MKPKLISSALLRATCSTARMQKGSTRLFRSTRSAGNAAERTEPNSVKEPKVAAPARKRTQGEKPRESISMGWSRNHGSGWPKPLPLRAAKKL